MNFQRVFYDTHNTFMKHFSVKVLEYLHKPLYVYQTREIQTRRGEKKRYKKPKEQTKAQLEFPAPRNFRKKKRGQQNRVCWEQRSWNSDSGKETDLRVSSIAASRDELFSWRRSSSVYQRGSSVTDRSARHSSR